MQKELMKDFVNNSLEIELNSDPVNEYNTPFLATMAFPTLFPDGTADPTNSEILRGISSSEIDAFSQKFKHLLKFAKIENNNWVYRFAAHPRFAYWAFNLLHRKRIISKGNLYKRNPGELDFTQKDLEEMLNSFTASQLMSKIFYYTKEITGCNAYWKRIRQELLATIKQVGVPTIFFTLSMAEYHWPDFVKTFGFENLEDVDIHKVIQDTLRGLIFAWTYFRECRP